MKISNICVGLFNILLNNLVAVEPSLYKLNQCAAKHKIPVDESTTRVIERPFGQIVCEHFKTLPKTTVVKNNGHSLQINMDFTRKDVMPTISNGPIKDLGRFVFGCIYFHWLDRSIPHEDHIFPAELHVVFYNTKYPNLSSAMSKERAIAIFAYTIEVQPFARDDFDPIIQQLKLVRELDASFQMPFDKQTTLDIFDHNPNDYFTYHGSAPMLACPKNVIWIDFLNAFYLKPEFISEIEKMTSGNETLMGQFQHFETPKGPVYKPIATFEDLDDSSGIPFVDANNAANEPQPPSGEAGLLTMFVIMQLWVIW